MQKALVMSRLVAIDHACILPQLPLSLAFEIKRLPHFHDYVLFEEKEEGGWNTGHQNVLFIPSLFARKRKENKSVARENEG